MNTDIVEYAKTRYTAKAYEPTRRISDGDIDKIKALLRFSPSSTNLQPWHFVIAGTEEGKARISKAAERLYSFNVAAIRNASHIVVFASRLDADEGYLKQVLAQEEQDGRFDADPQFKVRQHAGRSLFVNLHKRDLQDVQHWMDKQVYLNLGQFLLGVAALGIDATPMEGVETQILDEEFGLREKGYTSLLVVPLGYADTEADYNASLPKSRLSVNSIFTEV